MARVLVEVLVEVARLLLSLLVPVKEVREVEGQEKAAVESEASRLAAVASEAWVKEALLVAR